MKQTMVIVSLCWLLPLTAQAQKRTKKPEPVADTVTFVIDMRKALSDKSFDPKTETVGVRGGLPPLDWASTLAATDAEGRGFYKTSVIFRRQTLSGKTMPYRHKRIPYKFKIDSPLRKHNDGWEIGENSALALTNSSTMIERVFNQPVQMPVISTRTGTIVYHNHSSRFLPARMLAVYLPPGYGKDTTKRYPVFYMHDGQNLFDDSTSNANEWHVDEIAEYLINARQIQPLIVVGIYNTASRTDEYTPTQRIVPASVNGGATRASGGKAPLYGQMLATEIKPLIDKLYRTMPGSATTAIGGSSFGGLVSLYLGLEYPNLFGKLALLSPSLWWDNKYILNRMSTLLQKTPATIWLDIGAKEGGEAIEDARTLRQIVTNLQWRQGVDFSYMEDINGRHDEASWAERMEAVLRFLFPIPKQ